MSKSNCIAFLLIVFLSSCTINGSLQGLYSYYNKTKTSHPNLLVEPGTSPICNLRATTRPQVYITNGIELKECINTSRDAVIYMWKPKCKSAICYSLNALQARCKAHNRDLYIIAEYYDGDLMSLSYDIERPVFAIDTRYYKTDKTPRYLPAFLNDIIGQSSTGGNLLYFSNGTFLRSGKNIDSL